MAKRSYISVARAEAAATTRERVLQAAARFLREEDITAFSLDAVAKAAEVTRLTVYNQFGSRRGLLEAVFDDIALRGNLGRLNGLSTEKDAHKAINMLVKIFCEFWGGDPAIIRLHEAMAIDAEFAQALLARHERRRFSIEELVTRIGGNQMAAGAKRNAVDLIFALTSFAVFRLLSAGRRTSAVCAILTHAVQSALVGITAAKAGSKTEMI